MWQEKVTANGEIALVAIGANTSSLAGGPLKTVQEACAALIDAFVNVTFSRLYQSPAFPAGSGPDFVNAACKFKTNMSPQDLLDNLHAIEADYGRTRDTRWGPRTLDLDLLGYGNQVQPDVTAFQHWQALPLADQMTQTPDRLILPHPRLADRPFVLVPLADVAPDWTHPVTGNSVQSMLDAHSVDARAEITPL